MKCITCGSEIDQNANFCTNCGHTIENNIQNNSTQTPTPLATYVNDGKPQKNKGNTILIVVLSIIGTMVVVGLIAVFAVIAIGGSIIKNTAKQHIPGDIVDDYEPYKEETKTIKDPTGHEIIIVINGDHYNVDLSYLSDELSKLENKINIMTNDEIEKYPATEEQKAAMRYLKTLITNDKRISKLGLYQAILEENYSEEIVKYAISNSGIDWNNQAKISLLTMVSLGGNSKELSSSYLKLIGYTEEEIQYATKDIDYYEQAVASSCLLKHPDMYASEYENKQKAKDHLESLGFTKEEIDFAIKTVFEEL